MAASFRSSQPPRRRISTAVLWFFSIAFSLVLNLGLFGLMPELVRQTSGQLEEVESLRPVTIVRGMPPKPPPQRRIEKPSPPKREKPEPKIFVARPVVHPPKLRPKRLRFDFKPELPEVSTTLPVLPIQSVAFETATRAEVPEIPSIPSAPSVPAKESYGLDEIDGPLVPVSQVPPVYPLRARRRGIEGWIRVQFLVTERGTVEKVRILAAEPKNLFEKNVLKAVSSWRFKPGTVDGKAVKTWIATTLEFRLQ